MEKGLIRKALIGTAVVGVITAGLVYTEKIMNGTISDIWNKISYVNPENPGGFETCYLSEKDAGIPVTTRDVYEGCRQVVYLDGNNNPVVKPIYPKRVEPLEDYCKSEFMQKNEDGTCEYHSPISQ